MRVLVCGSREWRDRMAIWDELTALRPRVGLSIIHGDADGADLFAADWAKINGVQAVAFPADWATNGRAAGPIRNANMLREGKPDRGLAFGALWRRSGTANQEKLFGAKLWKPTGTGDMVAKMLLGARLPVRWIAAPGVAAIDLTDLPGVPS